LAGDALRQASLDQHLRDVPLTRALIMHAAQLSGAAW
jgi:hypothetical protein